MVAECFAVEQGAGDTGDLEALEIHEPAAGRNVAFSSLFSRNFSKVACQSPNGHRCSAMNKGSLLLLVSTTSYRLDQLVEAARRLKVPLVVGSDLCHRVEETFGKKENELSLDYRDPHKAAEQIALASARRPLGGIVPTSDTTAVIGALAAERLGLPWNPPGSTLRAGNKYEQRKALRGKGVAVPAFSLVRLDEDPGVVAARVPFPCVLKPLALSASRGVIRADDPASFVVAFERIAKLLHDTRSERRPRSEFEDRTILVEAFVSGGVALEGLLRGGEISRCSLSSISPSTRRTLLRGDPLRHALPSSASDPGRSASNGGQCTRALGLREGPVHAELRLSAAGPVILEIAARSIGGLCSRSLTFGAGLTLEELLIAHAMDSPSQQSAARPRLRV